MIAATTVTAMFGVPWRGRGWAPRGVGEHAGCRAGHGTSWSVSGPRRSARGCFRSEPRGIPPPADTTRRLGSSIGESSSPPTERRPRDSRRRAHRGGHVAEQGDRSAGPAFHLAERVLRAEIEQIDAGLRQERAEALQGASLWKNLTLTSAAKARLR